MGSTIKETDVSFDTDRPLTKEEERQIIAYNIHDVKETLKVFNVQENLQRPLIMQPFRPLIQWLIKL
jgi:hypothetical protein